MVLLICLLYLVGCVFVFIHSCSRMYYARLLYYSLVLLVLCFDLFLILSFRRVFDAVVSNIT
jgi:hypothetical protein